MDELERADSEARRGKSLDELAVEQGVAPFRSLDELRIAGLENEDVDAFIRSVKEGRR